ncbi:hypothetical protein PITC_084440 [Penicillium italicum]|uniref:Uncharacterized protein n=1 Tax=Penicillium italicum TaxID=40296 RepID=A0A0A2L2C1_PENIT|nr:hypothetical protein PITC_084440 [Penicillium italicum]
MANNNIPHSSLRVTTSPRQTRRRSQRLSYPRSHGFVHQAQLLRACQ